MQYKYFFKRNNFIRSNATISFICKLKNVSLTFKLTFSLKFWICAIFKFYFTLGKLGRYPANIRLDEDVLKRSWRRLSSSSSEDVFKTSWSRPIYSSWPYIFKTSSRRFQDVLVKTNIFVLAIHLQDVFKTFSRRLQDVFKTSSRHLQDVLQRYLQDVFKAYHQVNLF